MTRATIRTVIAVALATCALVAGARELAAQAKVDVTGTWTFDVTTDAGTGTPTVTLKQDGEKLAGHYSSTNLGEADLAGSVKGQAINFSFVANVQGNALDVTYTGTVDGKDAMKGTLTITAIGNGTFTAKRTK
jgi:hypothetical protein